MQKNILLDDGIDEEGLIAVGNNAYCLADPSAIQIQGKLTDMISKSIMVKVISCQSRDTCKTRSEVEAWLL